MKPLIASLAIGLLGVYSSACGSGTGADTTSRAPDGALVRGGASTRTSAVAATPGEYFENDGDQDNDDNDDGSAAASDNSALLKAYGAAANRTEEHQATAVVKSYFAAADAGDGARACSLLATSLATSLAEGQGDSIPSGHRTCAARAALLFQQQHRQLKEDDAATMVVTSVHLGGNFGLAALGFRTAHEGEILARARRRCVEDRCPI